VSDDKEFRAGALSGLLAVILVVVLAVMAMTALNTASETQTAQIEQSAKTITPGVDSR
jgi:predicted lysophospholipase L1 biosynthesis ABC-type transport system permease subunit